MNHWSNGLLLVCACLLALTGRAVADPLADAQRAYDEANYAKAATMYRQLAASGNAVAEFKLGTMYYSGKGGTQSFKEAARLYRLAAEQGHAGAQSNLATMYYTGTGMKQDFVLAHMWKDIAASNAEGDKKSRYLLQLKDLENRMSAKQIAEARELAKKCTAAKYKGCKL